MNYRIDILGYNKNLLDECFNILVEESAASNYIVTTVGKTMHSFSEPYSLTLFLQGSNKEATTHVLMDFDGVVEDSSHTVTLSPKLLAIEVASNNYHYWCILSALLQILHDTSSAFLTGYLLDKGSSNELEHIKKFNSSFNVTMALQINSL